MKKTKKGFQLSKKPIVVFNLKMKVKVKTLYYSLNIKLNNFLLIINIFNVANLIT